MTTATITSTVMRPVTSIEDSFLANEFLTAFIGAEPWLLDDLVPGGQTFEPVAIAEDGSAVEFEVYAGSGWDLNKTEKPLRRIILRHSQSLPAAA